MDVDNMSCVYFLTRNLNIGLNWLIMSSMQPETRSVRPHTQNIRDHTYYQHRAVFYYQVHKGQEFVMECKIRTRRHGDGVHIGRAGGVSDRPDGVM